MIERIPGTHRYVLTADGIRVAVFYNKVHARVLRPLVAAPDSRLHPSNYDARLGTIDRVVANYADNARLAPAA